MQCEPVSVVKDDGIWPTFKKIEAMQFSLEKGFALLSVCIDFLGLFGLSGLFIRNGSQRCPATQAWEFPSFRVVQ